MDKQQLAQWISEWLMGPNGPSFSRINEEGKEITVDGEIDLSSLVDYLIERCTPSVSLTLPAGPQPSDTAALATLQTIDDPLTEDYPALNADDARMLVNTEAELAVGEFRSLGYHLTGVLFKLYEDETGCKLSKETYAEMPRLRFFGPYSDGVDVAKLLRAYADMFEESERAGSMIRRKLNADGSEIPVNPDNEKQEMVKATPKTTVAENEASLKKEIIQ